MAKIPLKKKWVSIDAWRGYYNYDNSVVDGSFLYGNETHNKQEKEIISKSKKILKSNKIPHRLKTARTSNVFSVGWDLIVAPKDFNKAKKLLKGVV